MLIEKLKLEADETVIGIVRKHWFVMFLNGISIGSFALAPLLLISGLPAIIEQSSLDSGPLLATIENASGIIWYSYSVWLIMMWMALINLWTDYYLDIWVITNRRVVLIDQRGFFNRFVNSFRLERLQDMNIEINGIIATLLDFGTIEAQTAGGSNERFITAYMPRPREIKSLIVNAADNLTSTQRSRIDSLKEQGL